MDLEGTIVDPIQKAVGKPVVLIFVRSDCPISSRYAPEIQRLSAKYEKNLRFWLVYPSRTDTADVITRQRKEYGYKLAVLRDSNRELVKRAQVQITPEAAVFNTRGALVYHGRIDNWYEEFGRSRAKPTTHELDDAITATLAGHAVVTSSAPAVGCYISDLP
jgi:thiol-disulfide isomerase/thioredoxin